MLSSCNLDEMWCVTTTAMPLCFVLVSLFPGVLCISNQHTCLPVKQSALPIRALDALPVLAESQCWSQFMLLTSRKSVYFCVGLVHLPARPSICLSEITPVLYVSRWSACITQLSSQAFHLTPSQPNLSIAASILFTSSHLLVSCLHLDSVIWSYSQQVERQTYQHLYILTLYTYLNRFICTKIWGKIWSTAKVQLCPSQNISLLLVHFNFEGMEVLNFVTFVQRLLFFLLPALISSNSLQESNKYAS